MIPPLQFHPIFKERVWGGRQLASLYDKRLPPGQRIGESWEISDRPEGVSRIANGPFSGRDLRWLMQEHAPGVLGAGAAPGAPFPWLCKILDARDDLSLQVHPPASRAAELGGEPKTELWYVAAADPGAAIHVGLKRGVSRSEFESRVRDGTVAACFHRHAVARHDAMFVPSGRVHALGGGQVVFEIQQNSDTTYRVFDWNRTGLDGRPRELHIPQSLASIDFDDFEPALVSQASEARGGGIRRPLVRHELFHIDHWRSPEGRAIDFPGGRLRVLAVTEGAATLTGGGVAQRLPAGGFCLVPACVPDVVIAPEPHAGWLDVTLPGPDDHGKA